MAVSESSPSPLVTVVTPSFNSAEFIERTILAVKSQEYPRVEHILMDGGSTDHTMEIVERHRAHFTHIHSGKDNGMYDAIHRGFAQSSGEIMTWLNSDDEWLPGTLRTVTRLFQEFPDVEFMTSGFPCAIDATGAMIATARLSGFSRNGSKRGEFLPACGWPADGFIQQESTFWRRSLWERAGSRMDHSLQFAGDYELWSRFLSMAQLWCVEVPLGCFRRREGQKTAVALNSYLDEALTVFLRSGGKIPSRLNATLRVGFRRHAPPQIKQFLGRNGWYERRPHLLYDWGASRWTQSWY